MTSSSEGEILQSGQIIRDRWKINKKVGGGGFGEIFDAFDLQNHNERVAIKVESSKATKQVLKMEVAVLRRLQGKKHACKFYGCGRNDKFNYLVMSLQGKNLADLRRESPRQCFSVSTAIRLGLQILLSIKEIHSIGFLHRDIKPSNFAMGRSQSALRNVYMLDFGLARQYLNAKGEIRSPRSAAGFRGTVRYAAVTAHKNKEMGRSDDLYSFFYIIVEFLQGALPWRKIKDKDEVGRMKDEVNYEQLLEGCPTELLEIPTHLKTLGYPDDPDYDLLEKILRGILARMQINMEDPYDWELGYENISGRSRTTTTTNGNVSTRMKSHTTAVKDRGPEDKNRALDTQAPITMGEDDDEQNTQNCYRFPPMNSVHTAEKQHQTEEKQDKPKYKRQEFMRPKYGAVSFDVIDAVNARLAAASVGGGEKTSSNNDFFNRIRYDTSIENEKINNGDDVAVDFNIRPSMIQPPTTTNNFDNPNNRGALTAPGTPLMQSRGVHRNNPLQSQTINNDQRNTKSNRSITLSVNKKFPTSGSSRQKQYGSYNNSGDGGFNDGTYKSGVAAAPSGSRYSFDETADDDNIIPIDANAAVPRSPMNNRFPRTILSPQQQTQPETSGITSTPSSNNNNAIKNNESAGYISPRLMRRSISASKSAAPLASADSGLGGSPSTNGSHNSASSTIMSHFKNLVNSFTIGSGNGHHSRRRSLSRGISLDDHRSITNQQQQQQKHQHQQQQPSSNHATPSNYRRSEEPKDIRQALEDEERELRRQRRLRRRSDCQQMLPEKQQQQQQQERLHYKYEHGSSSPIQSRHNIIPSIQKTVIVNNDGAYRVESRLMNNGVVVESTPPPLEDKKSSLSCRRKRYQFLNFAPRAMSKS